MARELPTNAEIADRLQLLGDLLEIEGAIRHRVLAYRRGAARIRAANESVADLAMRGRAVELADIGGTLQAKIVELVETGEIAALQKARDRTPEGLAAVARIDGIGPKRAAALHAALGVASVDDLAAALAEDRLSGVAGIGPGTRQRIAEGIEKAAEPDPDEGRVPLGRALPVAEVLRDELLAAVPGARVEIAGSLRRGRETAHDIDIVGTADPPGALLDALPGLPSVQRVLSGGDAAAAVRTHAGIRAEVAVVAEASFGNLLQHATGSAAHNVRLREMAVRRGLSMSQHGIAGPDGTATQADEAEVYAVLGLQWIPPELREDSGELEAAAEGLLPALVTREDLKGELHSHTTWSDGTLGVAEMVEAARRRGLRYLAISDHSQSLAMAGGLDPDRVHRQWEEIREVDARHDDITVLRATEVDILADGRIDFDDDLLAAFDWVTASMHSALGQPAAKVTARVIAACESPFVDTIGHPTGRMMGRRGHAAVDIGALVDAAARTGTFLEVNGQPRRLDLDGAMARRALAGGVTLTIGADAHSDEALDYARYGVLTARRAGARAADVANTRDWPELAAGRAARLAAAGISPG